MTVEDNSYDFQVRDRLLKECKKMNYKLHYNPDDHALMLDMITYCSQGNQEEAVLNLKTTKEFQDRFISVSTRLLSFPTSFPNGYNFSSVYQFLFKFWKKSFIEIKVAVEKKEAPLRISYHQLLMRDYDHFLNEQNFLNFEAFRLQLTAASNNLLAAAENLNNIFKDLRQSEG